MWGGQYCCWGAPLLEGEFQNSESGGHWFSPAVDQTLGPGQSESVSEHNLHPISFQEDPPPEVRGQKVNRCNFHSQDKPVIQVLKVHSYHSYQSNLATLADTPYKVNFVTCTCT